jgi:RND family efflux transporter MFP subunit
MADVRPSIDDLRIDHTRTSRPGRVLVSLLVLALVGAAALAAAWWWLRERPVPVRVAAVVAEQANAQSTVLNASGYVTARRRATISSKVTGKVIEVMVEEGMAVRKGQVLARLDPTTANTYLTLSRAELAAARRALTETDVRLAQAQLALKRTRALIADGIVTQADLDNAQTEVDALQARLALAREQVTVSERQVAVRDNDLADLTIVAPFSGVAISKDAQPGEMISPVSAGGGFTRTGICTVVDMSSLEIEVDVNESYINRVSPAQRVEATLDAYPDWKIPARVITMVPTADRQKATVLVRIAFDPSTSSGSPRGASRGDRLDPRILPDMGVKVAFLDAQRPPDATARRTDVLVPKTALRKDAGQDVVFVLQGDHVERRAVRLGDARGDLQVVVSGLQPGEQVVVEGPPGLADGNHVVVR